jgi:putative redox protein
MARSKVSWRENMSFNVELNGHNFIIDATDKVGGKDQGPRPKGLLLSALGGCTGMDVVSILKKMKVDNYKLEIIVDANETTEHPKYYDKITIDYVFEGENLPIAKIKKAVNLSETRYCGVSEMLRKSSKIENIIHVNGEVV